jgi:phage terminase small subunit
MAKVNANFNGELRKNTEKGGAWIAEFSVTHAGADRTVNAGYSAWSNASAGKRWLKEMVLANTPKKSIKMVANTERDAKDKPIYFNGDVVFKVEA